MSMRSRERGKSPGPGIWDVFRLTKQDWENVGNQGRNEMLLWYVGNHEDIELDDLKIIAHEVLVHWQNQIEVEE